MKNIILILIICALMFAISFAGAEETLSAITGTSQTPMDYTMVYQYPIMHRDGTVVQLKLIKFNKPVCAEFDGETGCIGGFTQQVSNYARKNDPEHPVDTTETINLPFLPGKVPKVSEESLMHELYHAVDVHYHSRAICEANWRYSECMEAQAYDYTHLLKQVRKLKIKLI